MFNLFRRSINLEQIASIEQTFGSDPHSGHPSHPSQGSSSYFPRNAPAQRHPAEEPIDAPLSDAALQRLQNRLSGLENQLARVGAEARSSVAHAEGSAIYKRVSGLRSANAPPVPGVHQLRIQTSTTAPPETSDLTPSESVGVPSPSTGSPFTPVSAATPTTGSRRKENPDALVLEDGEEVRQHSSDNSPQTSPTGVATSPTGIASLGATPGAPPWGRLPELKSRRHGVSSKSGRRT